ncbi:MAG: cyclic nucleotide-binding domain-containing protein [Proteobacteria bacterium]|nr:cyclic nucleotide-binding domain-containing protein [Pseudomonadota bacterium]
MKKAQQTFNDGETIFREGEASDRAFEIVSGNVEIVKRGDDGEVRLALLSAGEIFGEMGILDDGKRSATAKAVGTVTAFVISREDFLTGVRDKPELALSVMANLTRRLRGADEMLTGAKSPTAGTATAATAPGPQALPAEAGDGGSAFAPSGFWTRLVGWKGTGKFENIRVQVAPLIGEDGDKHALHVVQALKGRKGLRVKVVKKALKINPETDSGDLDEKTASAARRVLTKTESDILIWGEVPPPGLAMYLKFVSFATRSVDTPGAFSPGNVLALPIEFGGEVANFLHAVTLAATVPKSEAKAAALTRDLPLALDSARAVLDAVPGDLTRREKGKFHMCYANALTRVAVQRGDLGLYQGAAAAYKACLAIMTEDDSAFEWALAHKNLGSVLHAVAERTNDKEALGEAVDMLRESLKVLTKEDNPLEWAATQNRLGEALYRLDFESGDIEMLKHALGAYQAALQVYTRAKMPLQWAEVMNNFAQVTQVLGEQLKSPEALEKAADACRAALEVRTKSDTPLLWAATQNNLGSALFLLAKMTKNVTPLEGAREAFDLASSFYRARGMDKMAAITEKNLGHVNQMLGQGPARAGPG